MKNLIINYKSIYNHFDFIRQFNIHNTIMRVIILIASIIDFN